MENRNTSEQQAARQVAGEHRIRSDAPPARFRTCRDCGQSYNVRDLAQVLHHIKPGHRPSHWRPDGRDASASRQPRDARMFQPAGAARNAQEARARPRWLLLSDSERAM